MTTNTPIPAPDLDAALRGLLAAAMRALDHMCKAGCSGVDDFDAAITEAETQLRAELQKPALHEPVSDSEVYAAMNAVGIEGYGPKIFSDVKKALESVLQGRAKPAQEEITDAEILTAAGDWAVSLMGPVHLLRIFRQVLNFRASKGEKT